MEKSSSPVQRSRRYSRKGSKLVLSVKPLKRKGTSLKRYWASKRDKLLYVQANTEANDDSNNSTRIMAADLVKEEKTESNVDCGTTSDIIGSRERQRDVMSDIKEEVEDPDEKDSEERIRELFSENEFYVKVEPEETPGNDDELILDCSALSEDENSNTDVKESLIAQTGNDETFPFPVVVLEEGTQFLQQYRTGTGESEGNKNQRQNSLPQSGDIPKRGKPKKSKTFICSLCGYKCSFKSNLLRHSRIHTGEKPYSCTVCDYKCVTPTHLTLHMRTHTKEKPFGCDVCDYRSTSSSHLNQHKKIHNNVRPFKCTVCDYRCAQSSQLAQHRRIHIAEKPFKCKICNFESAHSRSLKRHERSHL